MHLADGAVSDAAMCVSLPNMSIAGINIFQSAWKFICGFLKIELTIGQSLCSRWNLSYLYYLGRTLNYWMEFNFNNRKVIYERVALIDNTESSLNNL